MDQPLRRFFTALSLLLSLAACAPMAIVGGVASGALVADDRRTPGIQLEDKNIELKVRARIAGKHTDFVNISVTSFNRNVLITGEAPTNVVKTDIEKIVAGVENVRGVVNEVQVAGASSTGTRVNDAYITSKVKAAFLTAQKFDANHVKVVTESNVVYLLGIVLKQEADDATEIARSVGGVQKVVRVFEYATKVPTVAPAPDQAAEKAGG